MIAEIGDAAKIEAWLRREPELHIYEIGDLDPFFSPHARWFGWKNEEELTAVALIYSPPGVEVLLCFESEGNAQELLAALPQVHSAPGRFHAHLSPHLVTAMRKRYAVSDARTLQKMALQRTDLLGDGAGAVPMAESDVNEIRALFAASYPENWFDPRMLETGQYFGVRQENRLVAVGGVHVYSPETKVAALGNVTTHPDSRRRGVATAVISAVSHSLLEAGVETIGLNVALDNAAAIHCYEKLGFSHVAYFTELCCASAHSKGQVSSLFPPHDDHSDAKVTSNQS